MAKREERERTGYSMLCQHKRKRGQDEDDLNGKLVHGNKYKAVWKGYDIRPAF